MVSGLTEELTYKCTEYSQFRLSKIVLDVIVELFKAVTYVDLDCFEERA